MHSIAHYGLGLGIITSALGALVLCVLVIRYGFTPPDDESPEERSRRQFVTRLGHAAGAVCFALTAGLSAVVLGVSTRPPAEPPVPAPAVRFSDLDALRNAGVELGESVQTLGTRVTDVEGALQRLRTSSTDTIARLDRVERMAAALRVPAQAPPPARETKRPTVDRAEPMGPAPRKPAGVEAYEPALMRPAAALPRPVSLPATEPPAAGAPTLDITPAPSPQATVTPEPAPPLVEPAPSVSTAAVTEPPVPVRASPKELDPMDAATRSVVRLGDSIKRGLVNAGKNIRRFVEDLQ